MYYTTPIILVLKLIFTICYEKQIGELTNTGIGLNYNKGWINPI